MSWFDCYWVVSGPASSVREVYDAFYDFLHFRITVNFTVADVVGKLGLDAKDCPYAVVMDASYQMTADVLRFQTFGAVPVEGIEAIMKAFPGLVVRYYAECSEEGVFQTNDREESSFSVKVAVVCSDMQDGNRVEYFNSDIGCLMFLEDRYGLRYGSLDEAVEKIEDDLLKLEEKPYARIYKVEVVDTLRQDGFPVSSPKNVEEPRREGLPRSFMKRLLLRLFHRCV